MASILRAACREKSPLERRAKARSKMLPIRGLRCVMSYQAFAFYRRSKYSYRTSASGRKDQSGLLHTCSSLHARTRTILPPALAKLYHNTSFPLHHRLFIPQLLPFRSTPTPAHLQMKHTNTSCFYKPFRPLQFMNDKVVALAGRHPILLDLA